MKYDKWPLDYRYKDLEPYIDRRTVMINYTRHLQSYVDNLNKLLKRYENFTNNKSLEEILAKPLEIPEEIRGGVINQGGGVSNHNIYFSILSKNPKKTPSGKFLKAINNSFGSVNNLIDDLSNKTIKVFGI